MLEWDKTGERLFETGVDRVVLFPMGVGGAYEKGVAWNGVVAVNESPSGAEPTPLYADNIKYLTLMSNEEFGFSIEAYMYPDEFKPCNGEEELEKGVTIGQQKRKMFGFSYRTKIGNDVENTEHGYKIHLVYGVNASPSEKNNSTVNDNPEAGTMSWECTTTPIAVENHKPTAHIVIDSTKVNPTKLTAFEKILYGDTSESKLPLPAEVAEAFKGE